jgi:hypothetical protein
MGAVGNPVVGPCGDTIPMIPQMTDTTAPMRKATAVQSPCSVRSAMMMNMTPMKMKQMRYSALRNSLAPYISKLLPQRSYRRVRGASFPGGG